MTARERTAVSAPCRPARGHGGFTLLEVLVSLGIIIGALAGIAALLPAAGSRLADATNIDRAGTLAANARADLANRRVITSAIWAAGKSAVAFGEGLLTLANLAPASSSVGQANLGGQTPIFVLQDSTVGGGPPGVCYGCMLALTGPPPAPGVPVRMTTVVFRQPGPAVQGMVLTGTIGQPLVVSSSLNATGVASPLDNATAAALRKQYLAGCSWVLVVSSTLTPVWAQVGSSWTAFAAGQTTGSPSGISRVMLTGTDYKSLFSDPVNGQGTLQVFGFDGVLRLDERTVRLE